jgi:5-methylcytosine-specific restriction endonuclease McrA
MVSNGGRSSHRYQLLVAEVCAPRPGAVCALCFEPVEFGRGRWNKRGPSLDHKQPLNKGGSLLDRDNAQLAHLSCNSARGDMSLTEWFNTRMSETHSPDW